MLQVCAVQKMCSVVHFATSGKFEILFKTIESGNDGPMFKLWSLHMNIKLSIPSMSGDVRVKL